jgi:exopolysaccharide biosynthesis polyprenyl glycosylphosphotransferase
MSIVEPARSPGSVAAPAAPRGRRRARASIDEAVGLHVVADLAIVTGAYALAHLVRARLSPALGALVDLWWVPLAGAAAWLLALQLVGLYHGTARQGAREILAKVALAAPVVALVLGFTIFVAKAKLASRLELALYLAVAAAGIAAERIAAGALFTGPEHGGPVRTLVAGAGPAARRVAALFEAEVAAGQRLLVGFLDPGGDAHAEPLPGPILGPLADLAQVLDREVVDEVVFALPAARLGGIEPAISACEEVGVRASVLLPFVAYPEQAQLAAVGGASVLRFDARPHGPVEAGLKRLLDLALAGAVGLAAAPLVLVLAALVRLTSPGPAFFVQRRVGLNGREFRLLKLRTMVEDAETRRGDLDALNECDGPHFKMRADPRVTPLGRFLRRYSLDEMPQLWNVLVGEMSLVGPRPPLRSEVARYERWQRRRLSVRPGITGLWQVSGRSDLGFADCLRLDLAYIDGWSLGLDLRILAQTLGTVLLRRGSY